MQREPAEESIMFEGLKTVAKATRSSFQSIHSTRKTKKKKYINIEPDSLNECNTIGTIVWGKLTGSPWWPAIIIHHSFCGMEKTKETERWVYWFSNYKLSMLAADRLLNFREHFQKKFLKQKGGAYMTAVVEACKEYARKHGKHISEWKDNECILWATSGFLDLPNENKESSELPENIMMKLKQIAETNENKIKTTYSHLSNEKIFDVTRNEENLQKLLSQEFTIQDVCMGCFSTSSEIIQFHDHPFFQGRICNSCKERLRLTMFTYEESGEHMFCCVCGLRSNTSISCINVDCEKLYCHICIEVISRKNVEIDKEWLCFLCNDLSQKHIFLKKREKWRTNIPKFYQESDDDDDNCLEDFSHIENSPRKLRVLSLFDGIATGLHVLQKIGLNIESYYASETDVDAISVGKMNFSNSIIYLEDVRNISRETLQQIVPIDLLIGGSPCNDLSFVNPRRKGLYRLDGTGPLFFEFYRIKEILQDIQKSNLFFFFENVAAMPEIYKDMITSCLACKPVLIDAQNFTAAHRPRLFWGNIPGLKTIMNPENVPVLQDKLVKGFGRSATRKKLLTITTNTNSIKRGCNGETPVKMNGEYVMPWVTELEDVFGFPLHYTDTGGLSLTRRRQILGKAWSVDVIARILKPLCAFFEQK